MPLPGTSGQNPFVAPWARVAQRARYPLQTYRSHRELVRFEARTEALAWPPADPCHAVDRDGDLRVVHAPAVAGDCADSPARVGKDIYEALAHAAANELSGSLRVALADGAASGPHATRGIRGAPCD